MNYVIIPSGKYAPDELGKKGKIPMVLFPVNNGTILDLILEHYDSSYKIVIAAFEGFEYLVDIVNLIKERDVEVFKLDELKDLRYTISKSLEYLNVSNNDNVIINFGDTIVKNQTSVSDSIIVTSVTENELDEKWSYLKQKDGVIVDIIDKCCSSEKVDLKDYFTVCGVFTISSPLDFLSTLENKSIATEGLFRALQEYSICHPFIFEEAVDWYDFGHDSEYYDSGLAIKSREFNHISIDKDRGILEKRSSFLSKFKYEILWYVNLPKELAYVTPRIFDYSLDDNNLFVQMEYYSYSTLLELFLYGNLRERSWKKVFSRIVFVLNDFARFTYKDESINKSLFDMYYSKTIDRLNCLRNDRNFSSFFERPVIVNGIKYISLQKVMDSLEKWVNEELMNIDSFCVIHGDLCFANILIDNKLSFIKLIDPRGVFGNHSIYGDMRYDLAKLFHSVDGKYDYIIKELFEIDVSGNRINLSFVKHNNTVFKILKQSLKEFSNYQEKEIEFIEALLFLSMVPLHKESVKQQYAMIAVAFQILSRHFNIKEDDDGKQ